MRRDLQNMTKEEAVAKLLYVIYQLGYMAVVGGFLYLFFILLGENPKDHMAVICFLAGGAWYRKKMKLEDEAKKENGKNSETNTDRP